MAATRSLAVFPDPSHSFYYPKVGELHALWFYLLSGAGESSWRVTGLALLPLALTAGIALRVSGQALGLREAMPWLAPGLMLAPVVMIQPLAGYVDTTFAAFLLAAFAFGLLAATEGRFGHLALCALASGLALGVKMSFLYFGLPVLLVLATPLAWRGIAGAAQHRRTGRLLLLAVLLGWGCAYWYARNAVATGNPFYPHEARILGVTLFRGPVEIWKTSQEMWFVPSEGRPSASRTASARCSPRGSWRRSSGSWVRHPPGASCTSRCSSPSLSRSRSGSA
jgi:4-amino-4-deoxy-L-arabinose transferase-like glycosyltransferase